jgi:tetratricopeptide (TPR) repeat protein
MLEFGEKGVFRDLVDIEPGRDFRTALEEETNSCDVMLVIIGPQWTGIADDQRNKRLFDPEDYTRKEVETGLKRLPIGNVLVVPVLVLDATMPSSDELPESLRMLTYQNAISVHDDPYFDYDMGRLIEAIKGSKENKQPDRTIEGKKTPAPRMAPSVAKWLTGRDSVIETLLGVLALERNTTGSSKIIALKGMGGIGKTTLAAALAHHPILEQESPDGTLWAGLGPEPDLMSLLGEWGRQYDEDLSSYTSPDARSRALRSIFHDKCAFIVIDDAWRTEHAELFTVGGEKCRVLLTTRNAEVARAIAGEDVYSVETLTDEASLEFMEKLAPKAVASSRADVRRLIVQLGGLPLGLIIAGRMLAEEWDAGVGVQGILNELQAREKRLGMSSESRSLEGVLALSYKWLSEETSRYAFRLLGVFGGRPNTFSLSAAAAVCGVDVNSMRKIMVHLVNRALVEVAGEGRYTLHALVADYATNIMSESESRQGYFRHAKCFLKIAQQYTSENMKEWHILDSDWNNIRLGANWLSANINFSEAEQTWLELAADLAIALNVIIQARKPVEGLAWLQVGETACQHLGRQEDRAWLLLTIGLNELDKGLFDEAIEHFTQCESLFESLEAAQGLIYARGNLGLVHHKRGEYAQAIEIYKQVTQMCESSGDIYGTAVGYCNQGDVYYLIGEFVKALLPLEKSIMLCRQENIQDMLVKALILNGKIFIKTGKNSAATAYIEEAYQIAQQTGSDFLFGLANQAMGEVRWAQGAPDSASFHFQKSIELLTSARVQEELAEAHVAYGNFLADQKQFLDARAHWLDAIQIFILIGANSRAEQIKNELMLLGDI